MTSDERLMQRALDALERVNDEDCPSGWWGAFNEEIAELRERLAQEEIAKTCTNRELVLFCRCHR
jgi:hypothetical protein